MASRRMLDKQISVSTQVANLSDKAALIFTWAIPHSDDIGLLPYSHKTLRATIVPMWGCTDDAFTTYVDEIVRQGLWREFEVKNANREVERYYHIVGFWKHQTIKRDRQPNTLIKFPFSKSAKRSWDTLKDLLENNGFHLENGDFQMDTEEELKRNRRGIEEEENIGPFASIKYLSNIPEKDLKEFTERFIADAGGVRSKAEDLKLYCERTGRKYKNYKSFLLNALKRDFKERVSSDAQTGKYAKLS